MNYKITWAGRQKTLCSLTILSVKSTSSLMPGKLSMSMPIYNTEISNVQTPMFVPLHQCLHQQLTWHLLFSQVPGDELPPFFLIYKRGVTVRVFKNSLVFCCLEKHFGYVVYWQLKLFFGMRMLSPVLKHLWTYCNYFFFKFFMEFFEFVSKI